MRLSSFGFSPGARYRRASPPASPPMRPTPVSPSTHLPVRPPACSPAQHRQLSSRGRRGGNESIPSGDLVGVAHFLPVPHDMPSTKQTLHPRGKGMAREPLKTFEQTGKDLGGCKAHLASRRLDGEEHIFVWVRGDKRTHTLGQHLGYGGLGLVSPAPGLSGYCRVPDAMRVQRPAQHPAEGAPRHTHDP